MFNEEDVTDRLRRADPVRNCRHDAALLREILHEAIAVGSLEEQPVHRERKHRRALVAGGIAGLLALGVASPAIAMEITTYLAQTGWIGTSPNPDTQSAPEPLNTGSDDSEWITVTSADFVPYSVSVLPDYITTPDSYDRIALATAVATQLQQASQQQADRDRSPGAVMQKTSVISTLESAAQCIWLEEWLDADRAGDSSRTQTAATEMMVAASWPATVATDGGNIVSGNVAVAQAAAAGDAGPVQNEVNINCGSWPEAKE